MQSIYPLGPQTVRMKMPQRVNVKSVELLRAGHNVPFNLEKQVLQFTIPGVEDYEVAAIDCRMTQLYWCPRLRQDSHETSPIRDSEKDPRAKSA